MPVLFLPRRGTNSRTKATIEYFALLIAIRILYDYMYRKTIYPIFAYSGFKYNDSSTSLWLSWILLIIVSFFIKSLYENRENRISDEVVFIIFLVMFIPFTTMMGYGAFTWGFVFWNAIYYLVLFIIIRIGYVTKGVSFPKSRRYGFAIGSDKMLVAIAIISMLVVLYISGKYAHFRLNFSLVNVYDLRLEAREYALPTLLVYMFAWTKVLIPVLLAIFMRQKKWMMVLICIMVQLLSFGIDGAKAPLFMTIVVIIVQLMPKFNASFFNKWVIRGLSLMLFLGICEHSLLKSMYITSTLFRRMSFLTNLISSWYYDFFTNNPPDYFAGSFLRYLGFQTQYTEGIPRMIGRIYMHNPATNANNGMISDAFANLGYLGVIIMPILMIIVLRLLDRYSHGLDIRIYIVVSLYIAILLMNSFLATAFLTGGIFVLMILLSILDRDAMAESLLGLHS